MVLEPDQVLMTQPSLMVFVIMEVGGKASLVVLLKQVWNVSEAIVGFCSGSLLLMTFQ
jgi:transcriptional regulator GlxA family with amidase domain